MCKRERERGRAGEREQGRCQRGCCRRGVRSHGEKETREGRTRCCSCVFVRLGRLQLCGDRETCRGVEGRGWRGRRRVVWLLLSLNGPRGGCLERMTKRRGKGKKGRYCVVWSMLVVDRGVERCDSCCGCGGRERSIELKLNEARATTGRGSKRHQTTPRCHSQTTSTTLNKQAITVLCNFFSKNSMYEDLAPISRCDDLGADRVATEQNTEGGKRSCQFHVLLFRSRTAISTG